MELRRLLKKVYCEWKKRPDVTVILARMPRYFLLILALFAVIVHIPMTSALPPSPYLDPDWTVRNIYGGYPSRIVSFEIGKNVTNGGGAGTVYYILSSSSYALHSKIFWMDSGEKVKVWSTYPYSLPAVNFRANVWPANQGDVDIGSVWITRYVFTNVTNSTTGIGVYRNGVWYLDGNRNGAWDDTDKVYNFGATGCAQITGDWNGDGKSEIGIFKDGLWYIDYSGSGVIDANTKYYSFGGAGWAPIVGDWNADKKDEIGVYQNGNWYLDYDGNGIWSAVDRNYAFGTTEGMPVVGKW